MRTVSQIFPVFDAVDTEKAKCKLGTLSLILVILTGLVQFLPQPFRPSNLVIVTFLFLFASLAKHPRAILQLPVFCPRDTPEWEAGKVKRKEQVRALLSRIKHSGILCQYDCIDLDDTPSYVFESDEFGSTPIGPGTLVKPSDQVTIGSGKLDGRACWTVFPDATMEESEETMVITFGDRIVLHEKEQPLVR